MLPVLEADRFGESLELGVIVVELAPVGLGRLPDEASLSLLFVTEVGW